MDLIVEIPGLDRHRAAEMVSAVLNDHAEVSFVYPTSIGTYVFISEGRSWPVVVDHLVDGLTQLGQAAVVTAPPARELWTGTTRTMRSLTAMMAYPMELPFSEIPRNPYGIAINRWGVSQTETERLLDTATRWVSQGGPVGQTGGGGPIIPASAEDAAELVRLRLEAEQHYVGLTFRNKDAGTARILGASGFGTVTYTEIDDNAGQGVLDQAMRLSDVIRAEAERIDVAMILPVLTAGPVTTTDIPGAVRSGVGTDTCGRLVSTTPTESSSSQINTSSTPETCPTGTWRGSVTIGGWSLPKISNSGTASRTTVNGI